MSVQFTSIVAALRKDDLATNWEVLKSPGKILKTRTDILVGTLITVTAESAGDDGKIINSLTIKLLPG
ncbi:MAG: hypothetical protein JWR38_4761 [Mucilaginibacter sp.]|nr:hypothetical protein [Mucilaginibacter sp.]